MPTMRTKAVAFRPIRDKIFVTELDQGVRKTQGGLILPDDNMTERGIRERWARVYAVGPEAKGITPGEWVMIQHGRWTNGFDLALESGTVRLWMVDPDAILVASETDPRDAQQITL